MTLHVATSSSEVSRVSCGSFLRESLTLMLDDGPLWGGKRRGYNGLLDYWRGVGWEAEGREREDGRVGGKRGDE